VWCADITYIPLAKGFLFTDFPQPLFCDQQPAHA
jgi:hypothetical protein